MSIVKNVSLVLLCVAVSFIATAQQNRMSGSSWGPKNVVKLNPLGVIGYRNIPIYYERAIYGPVAISAGFGYKLPTKVGGAYGRAIKAAVTNLGGTADFGRITGFSLTPEIKFYLSERGAPRGFYIGPYFRYSRYRLGMSASGTDPIDNTFYMADVAMQYKTIGGGIQMGAQWIINDGFTIDWFFFGPGFRRHEASMEVTSNVVSSDQWQQWEIDFEDDVESELASLPVIGGFFDNFDAEAKTNGFTAKKPFGFPNWRFGLSLGYAF